MRTRTGNFPIGFRRGNTKWQRDISSLVEWTVQNDLEVIDLTTDPVGALKTVAEAGLRIGIHRSARQQGMISADPGRRAEALARNSDGIRACSAAGPQNYFAVMLPENPALPRAENYGYMVESFSALAPVFEESGSHYVIEGWPGPGALCCTPETYRTFFRDVPSPSMSVNYDPSHLIRMGIDPLRFLIEFIDRVHHVHGKDTEILDENMYIYGHEQPRHLRRTHLLRRAQLALYHSGAGALPLGAKVCASWPRTATAALSPSNSKTQLQRRRGNRKTGNLARRSLSGRLLTEGPAAAFAKPGPRQPQDCAVHH